MGKKANTGWLIAGAVLVFAVIAGGIALMMGGTTAPTTAPTTGGGLLGMFNLGTNPSQAAINAAALAQGLTNAEAKAMGAQVDVIRTLFGPNKPYNGKAL